MSIYGGMKAELQALICAGDLFPFELEWKDLERKRCILMSKEVREATAGQEIHFGLFAGLLEAFVSGQDMAVALNPVDKDPDAEVARIDPRRRGIWAFRVYDTPKTIRAFGGFFAKDIFLMLTWDFRKNITDFESEGEECLRIWDTLLFPTSPLKGENPDGYLSRPFHLV